MHNLCHYGIKQKRRSHSNGFNYFVLDYSFVLAGRIQLPNDLIDFLQDLIFLSCVVLLLASLFVLGEALVKRDQLLRLGESQRQVKPWVSVLRVAQVPVLKILNSITDFS